jgi:hypothetical protein
VLQFTFFPRESEETTRMSEYQYIAFRTIDSPVNEKNLEFMRRQSSRAEITPWSFDNEYQYGDFRGNAIEMLRRGYDLHLHYANFGIRKLLIRLPRGLPDVKAAKPYLGEDSVQFLQDKQGQGGTLSIDPYHEPGDLEELWEFDDLLHRLVPLRAEILDGDLRPLYLAHLAIACDGNHDPEATKEAPIPAGLDKLSDAQRALMELYGGPGQPSSESDDRSRKSARAMASGSARSDQGCVARPVDERS